MPLKAPGAVIVGGHVNGLGLVRALAARGIRTAVISTKPYDIAQHSRWVSAHAPLLEIEEQPDALADLLERRAGDWSGWALLPANDGALAALAQCHERLSPHYRVVAPPEQMAQCFLDKRRMLEVAAAVGTPLPHCYGPATALNSTLAELRFPVLVKPDVGYRFTARFGCKLFVARDRTELSTSIARVEEAKIPAQVFDLIPGPDHQIYAHCAYIDASGEPRGGITIRKLRQSPPLFGVARVAEIAEDIPALRESTIEIVRRIGFHGMVSAEFKLDGRDGTFRFLEVNGRSVIYNGLLRQAGLDLAALAWSEIMEGRVQTARTTHWPGVWIHLHSDVLYRLLRRRTEELGARSFVAPYLRPKTYAVWSASDPRPFFAEWSRTARLGARAAWGGHV